jgi:hypothetical protein
MNKKEKTFDKKLLELEKPNPSYKEKYEKEKKKMLEKKISISGRICLGILLIIGVLFIAYFSTTLIGTLPQIPPDNMMRITYPFVILGFILSVIWIILLIYLIISGKSGSRVNLSLVAGIGLAISYILTIVFTFISEFPILRLEPQDWRVKLQEQLAVAMFFMFVFVGLYLILRTLFRLEFKTHEKLLEIELQLASISEKIEVKSENKKV